MFNNPTFNIPANNSNCYGTYVTHRIFKPIPSTVSKTEQNTIKLEMIIQNCETKDLDLVIATYGINANDGTIKHISTEMEHHPDWQQLPQAKP